MPLPPFEKRGKNQTPKTKSFTPLNVPKESLVTVIKGKFGVQDPALMNTHTLPARDKTKYCTFHQDYGHTTESCIQLKRAIERLINEGHLKEYVSGLQQKDNAERIIEVITPQISLIRQIKKRIYNLNKPSPRLSYEVGLKEEITFSNGDIVLNEEAKVTPIVIEVGMTHEGTNNCRVKRVLVDTGGTKNILYYKCF